jgi:hypothetical protein
MKTKELIRLLQAADPSGEIECVVNNIDIYSVYRNEAYWDGRAQILIRDEKKSPCYNVVGAKVKQSGWKIQIMPLSIEDVLIDYPEMPVDLSEVSAHSLADWERSIAAWRKGEDA